MTITREGRGLLLTMGLIGLAALNTGNNLIYLMLALMIALLLLDLVEGWRTLHAVRGVARAVEPVFATDPTEIHVGLSNRTARPVFLIEVKSELPAFRHVISRLEPRRTQRHVLTARFPKRGRYVFEGARLTSAYPFGFFRFSRPLTADEPVLVYPELVDAQRLLDRLRYDTGTGAVPAAAGEDFSDIRPYRPGDQMRDIHWKATAKTGDLMVREFRVGISENMTVILDGQPGTGSESFEKAVSIAASLLHALYSAGHPVRLLCPAGGTGFLHGQDQLYQAMDLLALVKADPGWIPDSPPTGSEVRLVVTAGTLRQVPEFFMAAEVFHADSI